MQNFKPETLIVGTNLIVLDETPSTNSYLISRLKSTAFTEGTLVYTGNQTQGRGQQNTSWVSEKDKNVNASIVFYPKFINPNQHFELNKAITLAVCDLVKSYAREANVEIKWPNDILVDGKKVAGILIENSIQGTKFNWSVAGIGINVNQQNFGDLTKATSISSIIKKQVDMGQILGRLCKFLDARYLQLKSGSFSLIEKDYIYHLFRLNEEALYKINDKVFYGKILGVENSGKLTIQSNNELKSYGFKEIEFIF